MKLLLVEDEQALSRAVKAILEKSGYEVTAVYNGSEALDSLEKDIFDGVVMDIMMPVMDGLEALKHMRERGDHTPVLLLTAKSEIDDRVEGLDSGANDYLAKPFAAKELLARIRAMTRVPAKRMNSRISLGNIVLDFSTFELSSPTGSFRLSNKEFQVLALLMKEKRATADQLLSKVWGDEGPGEPHIVMVYTSYLGKKLSALHADIAIYNRSGGEYTLEQIK